MALLIIEGIIGLVIAKSKMTGEYQFYAVCIMAFLFLVVVIAVTVITIRWPRHLYEEIIHELEVTRYLQEFINTRGFRDVMEDILVSRIKPECLAYDKSHEKEG
ncbi:MAG: hypothetical protein AB1797_06240 [bacterium]